MRSSLGRSRKELFRCWDQGARSSAGSDRRRVRGGPPHL